MEENINIAFRETMIGDRLNENLFSKDFIQQRLKYHKISETEYLKNISEYLNAL